MGYTPCRINTKGLTIKVHAKSLTQTVIIHWIVKQLIKGYNDKEDVCLTHTMHASPPIIPRVEATQEHY